MAAKVVKAIRFRPETVAAVEAYAAERGVKPQVVYESAVEGFLGDARRGVPDLVEAPVQRPRAVTPQGPVRGASVTTGAALMMDRQRRANEQRARAKR